MGHRAVGAAGIQTNLPFKATVKLAARVMVEYAVGESEAAARDRGKPEGCAGLGVAALVENGVRLSIFVT